MKNNNVVAEEAKEVKTVVLPEEEATKKPKAEKKPQAVKKPKVEKDKKELHSVLFTAAWIVAAVALLFALLGQNAMNTKDGYATLSYHWFEDVFNRKTGITTTEWTEQEFVIPYLTTAFYALVALGLGLVSTGMGIASNILKKDSKLLAYLPGVVTSVLAMMCFLSTVFTNK